jgi:filamentous hemagglutinin
VRRKLASYSLDVTNLVGGPKARGFERILGITLANIDYLEDAIRTGVLQQPINEVRDNSPYGINCVVEVPVRGIGPRSGRVIDVRTVWGLATRGAPPRLVSAFPRP